MPSLFDPDYKPDWLYGDLESAAALTGSSAMPGSAMGVSGSGIDLAALKAELDAAKNTAANGATAAEIDAARARIRAISAQLDAELGQLNSAPRTRPGNLTSLFSSDAGYRYGPNGLEIDIIGGRLPTDPALGENAFDRGLLSIKTGMEGVRDRSRGIVGNADSAWEAGIGSTLYAVNSVTSAVVGGLTDLGRVATSSHQRQQFFRGLGTVLAQPGQVTARNAWNAWSAMSNEDRLINGAAALATLGASASKLSSADKLADAGLLARREANIGNGSPLPQTAMRERVLANIAESQSARAASNMGGGLVTDAVAIPDHTLRRLLQGRGLPSNVISEVRASFDGQVFARHGLQGDPLLITETATGRASGIYVTRGSAGATPDIRRQVLALPPSNSALVENPVFLARPQILLEGVVAPQPTFGPYATGGGWQVVTDGGFRTGALSRGW
jgi:hypothetical protein